MSEEEILKMMSRIKASPDGPDFISYLEKLSRDNYLAFRRSRPEANEVHKGYAQAIDALTDCFKNCDDLLRKPAPKDVPAEDSAWT